MFVAVNSQGFSLDQDSADPVGPFVCFIPNGTQPQAGFLEKRAQADIADPVYDHAVGIGQNDRKTGAGDPLIEIARFEPSDFQKLVQTFLVLAQVRGFEHLGLVGMTGIEAVLLDATEPGTDDAGFQGREGSVALHDGKYLLRVRSCLFEHSSSSCIESLSE